MKEFMVSTIGNNNLTKYKTKILKKKNYISILLICNSNQINLFNNFNPSFRPLFPSF